MTARRAGTLLALALAPAALSAPGPAPAADRLRFAPEADAAATKVFVERTHMVLESMVQRIDGAEALDPSPQMDGRFVRTLRVADRYAASDGGRPTRLLRSFEELEETMELEIEAGDASELYRGALESPLAGEEALFRWDADEGTYRVTRPDGEDGPAAFEGLREDLDLRALLPEEDVAVGDRWTVPGARLTDLLRPGGELALRFGELPRGEYGMLDPPDVVLGSMLTLAPCAQDVTRGELTAEWAETVERDGRRLARIELELDLDLTGDLRAAAAARIEDSGIEANRELDTYDTTLELEGEGELLWDLEAGRFQSLTLRLDAILEAELAWTQDFGSFEADLEFDLELSGEIELEARVE